MARRRRKTVGPVIPAWVWGPEDTTNEGVGVWQRRVFDWADENLPGRECLGEWMDVTRNALHLPEHWRRRGA